MAKIHTKVVETTKIVKTEVKLLELTQDELDLITCLCGKCNAINKDFAAVNRELYHKLCEMGGDGDRLGFRDYENGKIIETLTITE
jgi:hypothetical protein